MLKEKIRQAAVANSKRVIHDRRYLHAHPELSFQEFQTSAYIKKRLEEMGIAWQSIGNTGVVALIQGALTCDKVIALRADMDALPITEENEVDFCSQNKGVMHACGHDVHTSSLLGTAFILQSLKQQFGGTVKLIFQPAEEVLPGGAGILIDEGVLENPVPQMVIGQHVSPLVPVGKVGIWPGKFMASMDEIRVTILGKGGHGAQPHKNIDPVMIAAQMLVSLQQVVSRMANPVLPTVLSFGKVEAKGAINIIPDKVYLEGTFRTLDEAWRKKAHSILKKMANAITESMGGACVFEIKEGYPFLVNNEAITKQVIKLAGDYLGKENIEQPEIWMAAEDFSRYSQLLPSCFYLLGVGNEDKGINSSLHTSTFAVDEEALVVGTGLMAYLAVKQLVN